MVVLRIPSGISRILNNDFLTTQARQVRMRIGVTGQSRYDVPGITPTYSCLFVASRPSTYIITCTEYRVFNGYEKIENIGGEMAKQESNSQGPASLRPV